MLKPLSQWTNIRLRPRFSISYWMVPSVEDVTIPELDRISWAARHLMPFELVSSISVAHKVDLVGPQSKQKNLAVQAKSAKDSFSLFIATWITSRSLSVACISSSSSVKNVDLKSLYCQHPRNRGVAKPGPRLYRWRSISWRSSAASGGSRFCSLAQISFSLFFLPQAR